MKINYLVSSPGRCGSIFLTKVIAQSLNITGIFNRKYLSEDDSKSCVVHNHDPYLQLDKDIPVIHVMRKNLFKQIISSIIAKQYGEYFEYSNSQQPFIANLEMFERKYIWSKFWHDANYSLTNYNNRQVFYFEEFIGRSEVICKQLQIPVVEIQTQKNPYSENNILNLDQLKDKFDELENTPLSEKQLPTEWLFLKKNTVA